MVKSKFEFPGSNGVISVSFGEGFIIAERVRGIKIPYNITIIINGFLYIMRLGNIKFYLRISLNLK